MDNIAIPDWAKELDCAVTVCDADCHIIYMNERSREINSPGRDIIGHSLLEYHPQHAVDIINRLLATGGTNCYTIEKKGVHKLIYQSAWRRDGKVAGLVEISIVTPADMPHFVRK